MQGQEGEAAARKQRRATTSKGSLGSVSRDARLTPTLKSNLAVEGCWRAFLPALGSVAELTGMEYQNSVFLKTFSCLYNHHQYCSIKWNVCL